MKVWITTLVLLLGSSSVQAGPLPRVTMKKLGQSIDRVMDKLINLQERCDQDLVPHEAVEYFAAIVKGAVDYKDFILTELQRGKLTPYKLRKGLKLLRMRTLEIHKPLKEYFSQHKNDHTNRVDDHCWDPLVQLLQMTEWKTIGADPIKYTLPKFKMDEVWIPQEAPMVQDVPNSHIPVIDPEQLQGLILSSNPVWKFSENLVKACVAVVSLEAGRQMLLQVNRLPGALPAMMISLTPTTTLNWFRVNILERDQLEKKIEAANEPSQEQLFVCPGKRS